MALRRGPPGPPAPPRASQGRGPRPRWSCGRPHCHHAGGASGCPGGRGRPGVRRSPAMDCFPQGHGSGPPGGPAPSRWAEAPDVCVPGSPGAVTAPAWARSWAGLRCCGSMGSPAHGRHLGRGAGSRPGRAPWGWGVAHGCLHRASAVCRRAWAPLPGAVADANVMWPVGSPQHNRAPYSSHGPRVWAARSTPRSWFP